MKSLGSSLRKKKKRILPDIPYLDKEYQERSTGRFLARAFFFIMKNKRFFLVHPSDLTKQCKTGKIEDTDTVLIISFDEGAIELAEGDTGFFLGHEKLLNLEEKDILPLLKSTCQGGESIYFIGDTMKPIFDRLCNDIAVFCYGVGWHNTFGVRKVKLKRAGEQQTMDQDFLDSFNESFAVKDGSNPLSDLLATEKKNQTNATDKNERQENKRRNTKLTKIERPNRAQATSPKDQKKDEKGADSGVNIQELEAAVFGKKADKKQIKNNYSELQNAKAYLIVQIQDRLNEHIMNTIKKKLEDEQQYYMFYILLLKTETPEELLKSWKSAYPHTTFEINELGFIKLKKEAEYYSKICEVIYGEDEWEY